MSRYQRIDFAMATDTGPTGAAGTTTRGDTGPTMWGELSHFQFIPTDADTGGDLILVQLPVSDTGKNGSDTGQGWEIYNDNDCLGTAIVRAPRMAITHGSGSSDTGFAPIVFAGDRLRIRAIAGRDTMAGTLRVWFKDAF